VASIRAASNRRLTAREELMEGVSAEVPRRRARFRCLLDARESVSGAL
jgi:hypothetical protein